MKKASINCMSLVAVCLFSLGLMLSCSSPRWIAFTVDNQFDTINFNADRQWTEVQTGPFYGRSRICSSNENEKGHQNCNGWELFEVKMDICNLLPNIDMNNGAVTLCRSMTSWRSVAIIFLAVMLLGGFLVAVACFLSSIACGCFIASIAWCIVIFTIPKVRKILLTLHSFQSSFGCIFGSGTCCSVKKY